MAGATSKRVSKAMSTARRYGKPFAEGGKVKKVPLPKPDPRGFVFNERIPRAIETNDQIEVPAHAFMRSRGYEGPTRMPTYDPADVMKVNLGRDDWKDNLADGGVAEGGESWSPEEDEAYFNNPPAQAPLQITVTKQPPTVDEAVKALSQQRTGQTASPPPPAAKDSAYPQSATAYHPTKRDELAQWMLGDTPSPYRQRFVSETMGTTGIGNTGFGAVDLTPLGMGLGVQEGVQHGDYKHAAMSVMPGAKIAKKAATAAPAALSEIFDLKPGVIEGHFKKVGESQGTQPGGWYQGPDGLNWYVKQHQSLDHAKNEKLAAELYREAGVPAADVHLTSVGGKPAVAVPKIEGDQLSKYRELGGGNSFSEFSHLAENYPIDAWLGSRDVIGAGVENPFGNIIIDAEGKAHRIDFGGSLRYSGLGKPKDFGAVPDELYKMLDPNINPSAAEVFGSIPNLHEVAAPAVERLSKISDDKIWELVKKYGPDKYADRVKLAHTLAQRRDTIVQAWKERVGGAPPVKSKYPDESQWEMPPENDFTGYVPDVDGLGNATEPLSNVVSIKPMQINKTKSAGEVVSALKDIHNVDEFVTPKQLANIQGILDKHLSIDHLTKALKGLPEEQQANVLKLMNDKGKALKISELLHPQIPFEDGVALSSGRELAVHYKDDPKKIASHLYNLDKAGNGDESNKLFSELPGELKGDVAAHYDQRYFAPNETSTNHILADVEKKIPAEGGLKVEGLGMSPKGHMYGSDAKLDAQHLYTSFAYKDIAAHIAHWSKKNKDYAAEVYEKLPGGKDLIGEALAKYGQLGDDIKLPAGVQYAKPLPYGEIFTKDLEGWYKYVSQAYDVDELKKFGEQHFKSVDWVNYRPDTAFYDQPKFELWKKKLLKSIGFNPDLTLYHGHRKEIENPVFAPGSKKSHDYPSVIEDPLKHKPIDDETAFFAADMPNVAEYYGPGKVRPYVAKADKTAEIDWYETFGTHDYSGAKMQQVINSGRLQGLDLIIAKRVNDVDAHAGSSIQTQYIFLNTSGYSAALRSPEAAFNKGLLHLANPVWGIAGGGIIAFQALKPADAEAKEKKMATGGSIPKPKLTTSPLMKPHRLTSAYVKPRLPSTPRAFMPKGTGMIHSSIPGRTDKIPMKIASGSYIIPADVVSGLGQGNSTAGATKLNQLFQMGPYGVKTGGIKAGPKPNMSMPKMPVMSARRGFEEGGEVQDQPHSDIIVAGGEYAVPVEVVRKLGGGDATHGHDILDAMVLKIRKQTISDMKKLRPPKR